MQLHLFPGAHKTATTLLQQALELNRLTLESKGFAIARRQKFYRTGLLRILNTQQGPATVQSGTLHDALKETLGSGYENRDIVISIENIFGEVRQNIYSRASIVIRNLKAIFPEHKIQIHFYIRRQDSFLESAFSQTLHRGFDENIDAFLARFSDSPIDWVKILRECGSEVPDGAITVTPYETINKNQNRYVFEFFHKFTSLDKAILKRNFEGQLSDTNVTLSAYGMDIARAAFPLMPEIQHRRTLVKLLQKEFGVDKFPRASLSQDLRASIAQQHAKINVPLFDEGWLPTRHRGHYLFEDLL